MTDALASAGHGNVPLVAAGGIADGRAAAAALTLGAQGIVMGTRFLSAPETNVLPTYRAAVLATSDGGQSTVRAKLFDELGGPNRWPVAYDGRSISNQSFQDFQHGVDIHEIRRRHAEDVKGDHAGFANDGVGRAATWAGTGEDLTPMEGLMLTVDTAGVGLVKREQPAAEIVEEVRQDILTAFEAAQSKL